METIVTIDNKKEKLERFKELSTENKLNFWSEKLPINYIQYQESGSYDKRTKYFELNDFEFSISEDEKEFFHYWLIENYHELSNNTKKFENLLIYEVLKTSFDKKLEKENDKLGFIRGMLYDIETSFVQASPRISGIGHFDTIIYVNRKYNADFETFNSFIKAGRKPRYETENFYISQILSVENGHTLGKFWNYLKSLEANLISISSESDNSLHARIEELEKQLEQKEKRQISKGAQILLLHHLRLLKPITELDVEQIQKAKIIGALLNMGYENPEKNMMKVGDGTSEYETEKNYNILLDFLHEIGLKKLAQDINSIKKTNK